MSSKKYEECGYNPRFGFANYLVLIASATMNKEKQRVAKACGCYLVRFFRVLQLPLIRFTQQNSCCVSKPLMRHLQKLDCELDAP